jgi:hypothetical protein
MATRGPTRLRIGKEWMNDVALWVSNLAEIHAREKTAAIAS